MNGDVQLAENLFNDFELLKKEISKRIVGQHETVELLINALFSKGHCLLVGVPGLAKTRLVHTLSSLIDLDFHRIQFTPDLMPSDIIGTELLDNQRNFIFNKGPVFTNILLADEINRTPPKTQSALLEAMQEHTVSVGGITHELPNPFFVLATQNPIEQEGTYPLPEAQLDRFLFMLQLDYPTFEEELAVVKMTNLEEQLDCTSILNIHQLLAYQNLVQRVPVPDQLIETAVRWVQSTRPKSSLAINLTKEYISWGAGPRASQNLILAAKCRAILHGRFSPNLEDLRSIAIPVLQHRIIPNYKAEANGLSAKNLIGEIISI
jgi:MoxR-like ATPase